MDHGRLPASALGVLATIGEVTAGQLVRRGKRVIDFELVLIGVLRHRRLRLKHVARAVRQRNVIVQNALRNRIEPSSGMHVVRERLVGERIARLHSRCRKVAGAFQRRRHYRGILEHALHLPQSRIAAEEESLVLNDRAAKRSAELIAAQRRFGQGAVGICVQLVIAQELEQGAVILRSCRTW